MARRFQEIDPSKIEPEDHSRLINRFWGRFEFLSNFYLRPVTVDDVTYASMEHYFQAQKPTDDTERRAIMEAEEYGRPSPRRAKRLGGKQHCKSLRPDWDQVKLALMLNGLRAKFAPGTDLAQWLIATGEAHLEEGNHWNDTYWGTCRGKGQNYLGQLLMVVRKELADAQA